MRVAILGLGVQGRKRKAVAGADVAATVDPVFPEADFRAIDDVPPDSFDAAFVCTPDDTKIPLLRYLLELGKHVLVEKPLLAADATDILALADLAASKGVACYTAYNHRFEPHVAALKRTLEAGSLGTVYLARLFYGNGTAMDVKRSPWRDRGTGVLADLGSHLLDLVLLLFGPPSGKFELWTAGRFENRTFDHVAGGCGGRPTIEMEMTLLSWRNTFAVDVYGERGSAHVHGLCKWGPSALTIRRRASPSGRPEEESVVLERPDPTWAAEYDHFKKLCRVGGTNLDNDLWINGVVKDLARSAGVEPPA